jgi:hypothetical protein
MVRAQVRASDLMESCCSGRPCICTTITSEYCRSSSTWTEIELHPATDAPRGCQLERFGLVDPDPERLKQTCARLGLEVPIERGERPHLEARIRGPKGVLELT